MKQYFVDLESVGDVAIIGATSGNSVALENDLWKNGVFSYAFMDGLFGFRADFNKDRMITVSELYDYMAETVRKLTGRRRKPSLRNMDMRNDWVILEAAGVRR